MKNQKHIILIPVYNDWNSLNQLLLEIDTNLSQIKGFKNEILIVNDSSTKKINIKRKKFDNIKKITLLNLRENCGSQKAIAIGLSYLNKAYSNFFTTVMDGDGEDQPGEIVKMLILANKFKDSVITSNRKKRKESLIVRILYNFHLIFTFLLTYKWISFGNFTTFYSSNIKNILYENQSCFAHSSSVVKNCKIIRLYAKRGKRYYDNSNLNLLDLIEHSLRINALFLKRVIFTTFAYFILILTFLNKFFFVKLIFIILFCFFYILIYFIRKKHFIENLSKYNRYQIRLI